MVTSINKRMLKKINIRRVLGALGILCGSSIWGLMSPTAAGASILSFNRQFILYNHPDYSSALIDWSGTDKSGDGKITLDELFHLDLTLLDSTGEAVFSDQVVQGLQVQGYNGPGHRQVDFASSLDGSILGFSNDTDGDMFDRPGFIGTNIVRFNPDDPSLSFVLYPPSGFPEVIRIKEGEGEDVSYSTQFILYDHPDYSSALIDWSGIDLSGNGIISLDELFHLNLTLLDSTGEAVFSDQVVQGLQVQGYNGPGHRQVDFASSLDGSILGFSNDTDGDMFDRPGFIGTNIVRFNPDDPSLSFVLYPPSGFPEVIGISSSVVSISSSGAYWASRLGGDGGGEGGQVSTPEPSFMLGFITLGGVLLGSKRKTNS